MRKIIFFDIDGTIFSHRTRAVPKGTADALWALRARGVRLFMCTGRHPSELKDLPGVSELPFDGGVMLNGQYCYCGDAVIHTCPIDREAVRVLLRALEERPFAALFVEADRMYVSRYTESLRQAQASIHSPLPPLGDLAGVESRDILQIDPFLPRSEAWFLKDMPHIKVTGWHDAAFDIIADRGGKGEGIRRVLARYGTDAADSLAFGDGENDIEMFGAVGTGVAMGNAAQAVKDAADIVTDDIDEDGLERALRRLGLIG